MHCIISMDDTDNLETRGTGWLVEDACTRMRAMDWGDFSMISRHQLYVHPDIPYTSHNSSMVFAADLRVAREEVVAFLGDFLRAESAPGSDPGLCVTGTLDAAARKRLVDFGRSAKNTVLTKDQAHDLAAALGIHLSEHGGTGGGVIGALAGVGLRLWGEDGRYRGWFHYAREGTEMTVGELCRHEAVDEVRTSGGAVVEAGGRVVLGDRVKTVRQGGKSVLLVHPAQNGTHRMLTKNELKKY